MPCFAAHRKREEAIAAHLRSFPFHQVVKAHTEATADKKIALVIQDVKVSEVKQIMDFIKELRSKK